MADPTTISLSKLGIELLFRLAEKNGGKLLDIAGDTASKLRQALSVNFSRYFETAVDRCSHVSSIFDRSKSVDLLSLYVHISLGYSGSRILDTKLRDLIAEIPAKDSLRTFLILGSAGTGKTFFLRWLFLNLLENANSRIPFYIELRGINHRPDIDLLRFIYETVVGQRARISIDSFQSAMKEGEFIFILDGFDEIQHDRRLALSREIVGLQDAYSGLVLVLSSRPDEAFNSWTLARRFSVLPMSKRDAISLISKLPYKLDVRRKFSKEVDATLYAMHTSFLSNPLLLTIMLLTYGDLGEVPTKMHIFYEQAYETLFYRHDTWKQAGFQRKHYCRLAVDEFRDCLSSFCISSYKKAAFEFTTSAALELIKKAADFEGIDVDAAEFLDDLVESVCILQADGLLYKFTHRSFQEYFAAVFLTRGPPIPLEPLLDDLAGRRGDVVIPMAMDMNRHLIEKEWVLPNVRSITSFLPELPLRSFELATYLLGDLAYDGAKGEASLYMVGEPTKLKVLYAFKDLYPEIIKDVDCSLSLSEEDFEKTERLWIDLAGEWWNLSKSKPSYISPTNERWPYANEMFLETALKMPFNGGRTEDAYEKFIVKCKEAFLTRKSGRRESRSRKEGEWLGHTACGEQLTVIVKQVVELQRYVDLRMKYSRSAGYKLLD